MQLHNNYEFNYQTSLFPPSVIFSSPFEAPTLKYYTI